jgi:hypothetical protein
MKKLFAETSMHRPAARAGIRRTGILPVSIFVPSFEISNLQSEMSLSASRLGQSNLVPRIYFRLEIPTCREIPVLRNRMGSASPRLPCRAEALSEGGCVKKFVLISVPRFAQRTVILGYPSCGGLGKPIRVYSFRKFEPPHVGCYYIDATCLELTASGTQESKNKQPLNCK